MIILIEDKFKIKIQEHRENIERYNKVSNLLSTARIITFLITIYLIYVFFKNGFSSIYLLLGSVSSILFICLVLYHNTIREKLRFSKGIVNVNNRYISRIDGSWIDLNDIGEEFVNRDHRYSFDLDIVGKGSLFQLINITNTWNGRKELADTLLHARYNKDEILERQEAVKELGSKLDFCQKAEYISGKHSEKLQNPEKLIEYAESKETLFSSKKLKNLVRFLPIIFTPLFFVILIFKIESLYILAASLILIQYIMWFLGFSKINIILSSVGSFNYNLETYKNILEQIEREDFKSKKLNHIKKTLFDGKYSSTIAIKEIDKITQRINLKHSHLIYFLLNGLLLWDYECVFSLEDWRDKYGLEVKKWIEVIGEIECLMSLSVPLHIDESVNFPSIDDSKLSAKAKSLGHPLISSKDRVLNDVELDDNIFVITGSNMSGKTTFLRTLGINLVLAYSGAPVYASKMSCALMDIFTCMRVTDDLKNGISTFYAELLRIKEIIKYAEKDRKLIFLIDEIFRGTNSKDRILGAKNVLANLNEIGAIGAITTHDLELCQLDRYDRIKNYNFSEHYRNNKIFFDYKLREGKSTTTNARYLMKLVGIKILED